MPRVFLGVELGPRAAGPAWVSLRLSVAYAAATEAVGETEVRFETIAGRADACGSGLGNPMLALEACATLNVGRLHGAVVGIGGDDARWDGPWLAAGLLGRLVVLALPPWRLEAEAGAFTPLRSHRFSFAQPQGPVEAWRTPDLGGCLGISAGVTIR